MFHSIAVRKDPTSLTLTYSSAEDYACSFNLITVKEQAFETRTWSNGHITLSWADSFQRCAIFIKTSVPDAKLLWQVRPRRTNKSFSHWKPLVWKMPWSKLEELNKISLFSSAIQNFKLILTRYKCPFLSCILSHFAEVTFRCSQIAEAHSWIKILLK